LGGGQRREAELVGLVRAGGLTACRVRICVGLRCVAGCAGFISIAACLFIRILVVAVDFGVRVALLLGGRGELDRAGRCGLRVAGVFVFLFEFFGDVAARWVGRSEACFV